MLEITSIDNYGLSGRPPTGVKQIESQVGRTFCSRLAMAGAPVKTIQILAGHKTISITARYAHLGPNTLHAAVDMIQVPGYTPEQSIPKITLADYKRFP